MFGSSRVQSVRHNPRLDFQKTLSIQGAVADLAFWVFHSNILHLFNHPRDCFTSLGHFSSLWQSYGSPASLSELPSCFLVGFFVVVCFLASLALKGSGNLGKTWLLVPGMSIRHSEINPACRLSCNMHSCVFLGEKINK